MGVFSMKLLIKHGQIITMNPLEEIVIGDILIEDGRIAGIGRFEASEVDEVIDARDRTIIPGFVQTHVHLCQTLFRGQADDLQLLPWLRERIWPLEAAHDPDSVFNSAVLGIAELIKGGTTTILDMETVHHTEAALEAIAATGIRAVTGKVMMDAGEHLPPGLRETTAGSLQESVDLLERWHLRCNGRMHYAFSPRFVLSCSEELLLSISDLAAKYGVLIHTHAAESLIEVGTVQALTGRRNVHYLDHLGLTGPNLVLAHCIWLDEQEKQLLAKRGVKVAHCPSSNLKLASGIADIPGLCHLGVAIGLGADGAPCNNNLSMLQEMRLAALLHKPAYGPTAMDARTVLRMATIEGAKALGLENEIGSIEAGKKADLAILNLNKLHTFPSAGADPVSGIVYAARDTDVEAVFVDGQMVMRNHALTTIDEEQVLLTSNRSINRLLTSCGLKA